MTEPVGRHRKTIEDPVQLDLLRFFMNEFKDVYHLPTGVHDLHLLETGEISDDEFFDRMTARYIAQGGHPGVDGRTAAYVVFGRGMAACGAMIDAVRQVKGAGYRTALDDLAGALTLWRRSESPRGRRSSNNPLTCSCPCGRRIRAAAATLAAGTIRCGLCDGPFTVDARP